MMRTTGRSLRLLITLAGAVLLPACNAVTTVDDLFLNDINNVWPEEGNTAHVFFFQPSQSGKVSESTFTGTETLAVRTTPADLEGSFKNRDIHFTVKRSAGNVEFTGTFRDENVIDLRSQGRTLVVRRSQQ